MRWIIGDIHGMLKPLEALITAIPRQDPDPTFYFVGDYVNRGRESRGVIDLLLSLPKARFIRGNHDDIFDQVLSGTAYAANASQGNRFLAMQWFLEHGLFETLQSYGVTNELIGRAIIQRSRDAIQPIIDLVPEAHRTFIHFLPVHWEDDDLFLIHGKWSLKQRKSPRELIDEDTPMGTRQEVLWGRFNEAELLRPPIWKKRGFFGHTPVPTYKGHENDYKPIVTEKLVLLDTAAALSPQGRLTAMCAETSQIIQVDIAGKLL